MDYRKSRRSSPRRDSYLSPSRRYQRSRSHSRSPRRRSSPFERRLSRTSPKQRRSRSRTPPRGFPSKRDMNGHRRSRSPERRSRIDVEKPQYWGPKDPSLLRKAVTSPHRLVVVKKTGAYDDEGTQKQDGERNRASYDVTVSVDKRNPNETRDYSSRRNRETHLSNRHSPNEDCDRTERYRKSHENKNVCRSNDKSYDRGYRSLNRRDNSRDRRPYDKNDEKKSQRRTNRDKRRINNEHRYQKAETDDRKNEEQSDDTQQNSEENEESEEYDIGTNGINSNLVPGMPMRPPLVGPFPRVIPIAPFPIPPFRPPHMRFPPPFMPRPFRLPLPRVFPPARFYHPVPPTY